MGISSAPRGDSYNIAKIPNFRFRTKNSVDPQNAHNNAELDAVSIFKNKNFPPFFLVPIKPLGWVVGLIYTLYFAILRYTGTQISDWKI